MSDIEVRYDREGRALVCEKEYKKLQSVLESEHNKMKELEEALEWMAVQKYFLTLEKNADGTSVVRQMILPERSVIISKGESHLSAIQSAMKADTTKEAE